MGTRGLTIVKLDGEARIAQYGQWDHYPSGQGITALEFCREHLTNDAGSLQFKSAVKAARFITDDEYNDLWKEVGVDLEACDGWVNLEDSGRFKEKYPHLTRDIGAGILQMVYDGATDLRDSHEFAEDGLFCEGIYVVDLDERKLQVYYMDCSYPQRPSAEFDFDKLPDDDMFLEICEGGE